EIQVFGDHHGNIVHLGERDCSIQRRHQKVIEEAPSPVVSAELRARMGAAALAAARAVAYVGAGTCEFLVDEKGGFYFLELNARLQVEHPVTEAITGLDLVALQLHVAEGRALPFTQDQLKRSGHAIEVRVYAEDPDDRFLPQTGTIARYVEPSGPGVRVDAGVTEGSEVGVKFDPMLSKLICYAPTRDAAIDRVARALRDYVILGTKTNVAWLRRVVTHPAFRDGLVSTRFLSDHEADLTRSVPELVPLVAAALANAAPRAASPGGQRAGVPSVWEVVGAWGR
ncbi:MAG TPA: 3-methylcrotonyl-CoA carboxylase, partial [Thermoanaerobaculia bacterium]|nr:3-methylcrotonyl-CoA carboxylase [Thermoanaerobaculia bacterium]